MFSHITFLSSHIIFCALFSTLICSSNHVVNCSLIYLLLIDKMITILITRFNFIIIAWSYFFHAFSWLFSYHHQLSDMLKSVIAFLLSLYESDNYYFYNAWFFSQSLSCFSLVFNIFLCRSLWKDFLKLFFYSQICLQI